MLIIYAHPNKKGHCGFILEKVLKKLKTKNLKYDLLNLYASDFNPVLKNEEHYTSGGKKVTSKNKQIQKMLMENDKLIFIYPTWWNGTPAILKGFFDRILVSGYAFEYRLGIPRGLLNKKKAAVITTTGGSVFVEKIILGNHSLSVVTRHTLNFCGIKAKGWMIGSATKLTDKNKNKIKKKVSAIFAYLEKEQKKK